MIYRKVLRGRPVRAPCPIVLGGDHSITWPRPRPSPRSVAPRRIGIVHFDAHADTAPDDCGVLAGHGTPMRRLIESGAVSGRNFVQVGLRGYWPPPEVFAWMQAQGMRCHLMREIEERGAEAVIADAIAEALDGPDLIYLSLDIDVIDPGMAPGTGTPEPGGMLTREVLRAVRQIVGRVELAGMDVVEVSPPYDHAEATAMAAHRAVLEAISALAVKKRAGQDGAGWRPARGRPPRDAHHARSPRRARGRDRGRSLAALYDLDLRDDPGDLDLYLALAARERAARSWSSAVGTGRLAVPLAAAGHRGHRRRPRPGDAGPGRARRAAGARRTSPTGGSLELVEADLLAVRLRRALRAGLPGPQLALRAGHAQRSWRRCGPMAAAPAPGRAGRRRRLAARRRRAARLRRASRASSGRAPSRDGRTRSPSSASARYDTSTATVTLTTFFDEGRPGEPVGAGSGATAATIGADELRLVTAPAELDDRWPARRPGSLVAGAGGGSYRRWSPVAIRGRGAGAAARALGMSRASWHRPARARTTRSAC